VPYLGVVLSDIVHLKDVLRAAVAAAGPGLGADVVPWLRVQACAAVLRRALAHQQAALPFKPLWHMVQVLRVSLIPVVTEDELVELSREREPPAGAATSATATAVTTTTVGSTGGPRTAAAQAAAQAGTEAMSAALTSLVLSPAALAEGGSTGSGTAMDGSATGAAPTAAAAAAAGALGPDQVAAQVEAMVRAVFDAFDADGNGAINQDEFRNLASYFPFVYSFGTLDRDRDGLVTREELLAFFLKARDPRYSEQLHKLFPHSLMLAPTTRCGVCGRAVLSLTATYYRCSKCGMCCHQRCRELITSVCRPPDRTLVGAASAAVAAGIGAVRGAGLGLTSVLSMANIATVEPGPDVGADDTGAGGGGGIAGAGTPHGDEAMAPVAAPVPAPAAAGRTTSFVRAGFSALRGAMASTVGSMPAPPPATPPVAAASTRTNSASASLSVPLLAAPTPPARAGTHRRNRSEGAAVHLAPALAAPAAALTAIATSPSDGSSSGSGGFSAAVLAPPSLPSPRQARWAARLQRQALELEMRLQEEQHLLRLVRSWLDGGEDAVLAVEEGPHVREGLHAVARQLHRLEQSAQQSAADVRALTAELTGPPT
jgi:hypothetical protein